MKKTLLTLMIGAGMLTASAATTPPEVLYVVGTMNDWTAPDIESGRTFQLTDPDGDMVYTGSLEVYKQGQLEFKIFTEEADWNNPDAYLGAKYSSLYLFNNTTHKITLGTWPDGYGSNIYIPNWQPGVLDLSLTLEEVDGKFASGELLMSSKTQPDFPKLPDTMYVIGAFNDYQLPEGTDLNGAFPLGMPNEPLSYAHYYGKADIPADEGKFAIYFYDPETEKDQYICGDAYPFKIVSQEEGTPGYYFTYPVIKDTFDKTTDTFIIENWTGGTLEIDYDYLPKAVQFTWNGAPLNDFPQQMNVVLVTPDGNKLYVSEDGTCQIIDRQKVTGIFFTTEDSANPAQENIWGVLPDSPALGEQNYESYTLMQGGAPIKVEDTNILSFYVNINRYTQSVTIQKNSYPDYSELNEIYLVGYMTGWRSPDASNAEYYSQFALPAIENGVFEGSFLLPYDVNQTPLFRFYSRLTGWDGGDSVGSGEEDFTERPIVLGHPGDMFWDSLVVGGKGNWQVYGLYEDTYVNIVVDLSQQYIIVNQLFSGVESVAAEDAEAVYYNLQGVRVANPANGIYLKVSSKGTQKVYIK